MRRSHNMRRGGGGGALNRSGGPLITAHLQDIDLELQLLKRKREMLEQQQFPYNQSQQRNYNRQQYSYNEPKQGGSNNNFPYFNDGPHQNRKSFGKKRQSDGDRQYEPYPKRPAGQGQRGPGNQKPNTVTNQQRSSSYRSGQGRQRPQRPDRKFVGNKVTKPSRAAAPPNKLAFQPVGERNSLVAAAVKSVAEVEDQELLRLLPDRVPTKQMTGRLELALGSILKDIRDKYTGTSYSEVLHAVSSQRVIKNAIRERLRTAMLGKIVGATPDILQEYRAMFPTDDEIVNKALDGGSGNQAYQAVLNFIDKQRPDEYFRENMHKLIDQHLQEMFSKLEDIYDPLHQGEDIRKYTRRPSHQDKRQETNNQDEKETDKEVENDGATTTTDKEAEKDSTGRIDKEAATEGTTDKDAENDGTAGTDETNKDGAVTSDKAAAKDGTAATDKVVKKDGTPKTAKKSDRRADRYRDSGASMNVTHANINEYKRMLPRLLKKYIPTILKLLNLHKMYRSNVVNIVAATRDKYAEYSKTADPSVPGAQGLHVSGASGASGGNARVLPYYVKVMGKPQLPRKKVMHTFLDEFHPKSIKRHRTIHNLLFIGFNNKADFDGIVKADGALIGTNTISIRACDQYPGRSKEEDMDTEPLNNSSGNINTDKEPTSETDITGSDENEQVNDSIKDDNNDNEENSNSQKDGDDGANSQEDGDDGANSQEDGDDGANSQEDGDDGPDSQEEQYTQNTNNLLEDIDDLVKGNNEAANGDSQNPEPIQPTPEKQEENPPKDQVKPEDKEQPANPVANGEKNDQLAELKNTSGRSTPTRASTRLANTPATPSSIRTRRASRLVQN